MKHTFMKRIFAFCLSMILCASAATPAYAAERVNTNDSISAVTKSVITSSSLTNGCNLSLAKTATSVLY